MNQTPTLTTNHYICFKRWVWWIKPLQQKKGRAWWIKPLH